MSSNVPRGFDQSYSPITDLYFSDENVELLQKKLVLEVFKQTSYRIPFQDKTRLLIAMKYVHNHYAKHLPTGWREQLRELDDTTIRFILPDVITAVELVVAYEETINNPRPLLDPPINVSRRQTLSLESRVQQDLYDV